MTPKRSGESGLVLEELLRAYFLRAGFFVVRGVPIVYDGEDLTDIDLFLYERPSGAARRIQVVDIKYKQKPKAVERIFWTRGLMEALDVDGAYVASTDKRPVLRQIGDKVGVSIIDGSDLNRIRESPNVLYSNRLTDEELVALLQQVDKRRRDKALCDSRKDILATLSDGIGTRSLVPSLGCLSQMAALATTAYPGTDGAEAACRLAYLSAAIACAGLDYISVEAAFKSTDEKRELLLNAIRFGASDSAEGMQHLRLAMQLIEQYAPGGVAVARQVEAKMMIELQAIPAEIVADQAGRLVKDGSLFTVARELESAAYERACPTYDQLTLPAKSMLGAFLDYAGVRREAFASSRIANAPTASPQQSGESLDAEQNELKLT